VKSRQLSNKPVKSSQVSNKPVSNKPVSLIAEFSTREIKVPRVVREQLVKNR
jgi:hypothetical protein